jgi:protease-4
MTKFFTYLFKPITIPLEFINRYFKVILFLTFLVIISNNTKEQIIYNANLAKIKLNGAIFDSESILTKIEKAYKNDDYKGVLFVIDSPGGAVAPSIEIAEAIKSLSHKKPVVVYAKGIMASGGYYSAIWANSIVANPGSLVGSIGVVMDIGDFSELASKIGYKPRSITAGKYKAIGNPFRSWEDYESAELQKIADDMYNMFITDVAKARGLKTTDDNTYADAHIFTSFEAKKVGLIDEIGTMPKATSILQKLSKVQDVKYQEIYDNQEVKSFMQEIVSESILKIISKFYIHY